MLQEPLEKRKKRKGHVRGTVQHPWVLCFDGASIDDATYAGCGAVLMTHARSPVEELSKFIGAHTLHTAEYVALFIGLKVASSWNVDNLHCYGASQIIHNQQVRLLIGEFKSVKLEWVRKADNLHAARLAYQAINLRLDRELTTAETDSEDPENTKPKKDPAEFSDDDDDYYQHPISKNSSKQPQQHDRSSPDSNWLGEKVLIRIGKAPDREDGHFM
ncbi:unnamed protein product [Sphagnum jensenii]